MPTPEAGAQLLPEIEAYLTQHDVYQKLDGVVKELVQQMPEDPVAFLVQRLQVGPKRQHSGGARAPPRH